MKIPIRPAIAFRLVLVAGYSNVSADTFLGNGVTSGATQGAFNGGVGGGSLTLTDDGTNIFGSFTKGTVTGALLNNSLTIYIDSVAGGFANNSGFKDTGDGNRKAISGYSTTASQSPLTFVSGFLPDYAISLEPFNNGGGGNFGGLWQLANGAANSMPFIKNVNLSPIGNSNAAVYTFSFSVTNIGLTIGAGQSFALFGTFDSTSGNRSSEAIAGNIMVDPTFSATNSALKGFIPFDQTSFATYTTEVIPEPAILSLVGLFGAATFVAARRRKS